MIIQTAIQVYQDIEGLKKEDQELLNIAHKNIEKAYAR